MSDDVKVDDEIQPPTKLKDCPGCGKLISNFAYQCVHCGKPIFESLEFFIQQSLKITFLIILRFYFIYFILLPISIFAVGFIIYRFYR
jgi:hypothetical protein